MKSDFTSRRRLCSLAYSIAISFLFANLIHSQEISDDGKSLSEKAIAGRQAREHVPGRVLLILDPLADEKEKENAIRSARGRTVETDPRIGLHVVELEAGVDEEATARTLRGHRGVLAAELDEIVPLSDVIPNDPNFAKETHLTAIKAPKAWVTTTGIPSVIVAVIDTGVNGSHPDLAGRLVPGWNTYNNTANSSDVYGHGTKVAGTVIAATNNGRGVAAICWNCMLMPIRASATDGTASYSALAAGLTWAADRGARVANMSYAAATSTTVTAAAKYFMSKGGLVFSSAGNYGAYYPNADNPYIVTVSGTDISTNTLYYWSNWGKNIDVTAPGCNGSTTTMTLGYSSGCGTSYAAPIAAGVAALIYSANPRLTAASALTVLKKSATDIGPAGWDTKYGAGMVNAQNAVAMALAQ
jgi:subtilisin family serine protease